jgi:hypothetical protein
MKTASHLHIYPRGAVLLRNLIIEILSPQNNLPDSHHGGAVLKFNFNAEIPENIQMEQNISAPHENTENN